MKRRTAGPQLLERDELLAMPGGYYLPQGTSQWTSVAEHPPSPAVGARCWWAPAAPPGDGWRTQTSNI